MPKLNHLLILLISLLSTGCFEIVEEIEYKKDGSGNFSYIVNMSQSREKLRAILSLDSTSGLRVPTKSDIQNQMKDGINLMKGVPGIKNISIDEDYENFIFKIKFSFDSLQAMNLAAKKLHQNMSPYGTDYIPIFNGNSSGWVRQPDAHTRSFLDNLNSKNPAMLKNASYTTVYRFQEEVSTPDKNARLAGNHRAVMYKYNMSKLANNPSIITQNINLK